MFKTKKTQFAIRKLAKGAVAVLLSFGILAGPSAPIVSAASEAIQNEMTDDTTSNEVTSDTTSVVEESVPVENNTAELLIILSNQFKQKKLKVLLQLKM